MPIIGGHDTESLYAAVFGACVMHQHAEHARITGDHFMTDDQASRYVEEADAVADHAVDAYVRMVARDEAPRD